MSETTASPDDPHDVSTPHPAGAADDEMTASIVGRDYAGATTSDTQAVLATPPGTASLSGTEADADLHAALERLSQLAIGGRSLESSLTWVATLAVLAIPGAQGAGVTMVEAGHSQTVCASHEFVRAVDEVQYSLGQGPCVEAATQARTVTSQSLNSDRRWPEFGPRSQELGVASVMSLPLTIAGGEVMGALNVYAHEPDVFTAEATERGEVFATAAAVVVHNARELMQARRLAEQLQAALTSRATIDQAIGIVLSRQGTSPDDAFATLKRMSRTQNVKLAVVAERIVQEAMLRARARHAGDS